jgi:hypothetical protein
MALCLLRMLTARHVPDRGSMRLLLLRSTVAVFRLRATLISLYQDGLVTLSLRLVASCLDALSLQALLHVSSPTRRHSNA